MKHEIPSQKTEFINIFENIVRKKSEKVAVVCNSDELTYLELNERANRLAHFLIIEGISTEKIVGVYTDRRIDLLVSIIAIFKAGGAYLPLDPLYPGSRIEHILYKSKCSLILTTKKHYASFKKIQKKFKKQSLLETYEIDEVIGIEKNIENPIRPELAPKALAYVIFTSGSTGSPKGVMIQQDGLLNHLYAKIKDLYLIANSRVVQSASQCFDISIWQFLAALLVGGQTHIFTDKLIKDPKQFFDEVQKQKVNVIQFVPSLLRVFLRQTELLDNSNEISSVKIISTVGEPLAPELCKQWFERYPFIPILNHYGPTECSDGVTHQLIIHPLVENEIYAPIGEPIENLRIYIAKEDQDELKLCQEGEIGELCVSGVGVARGYINDTEKTQLFFKKNPFCHEPVYQNLYKTGDLVRREVNGSLVCLGRKDRQIKYRGYRIELGEIEESLNKHSEISECAVSMREIKYTKPHLATNESNDITETRSIMVAYLVTIKHLSLTKLRQFLKKSLPPYMIPDCFLELDKLPLNANGKIDFKSLPIPDGIRPEMSTTYVKHSTKLEKELVHIWQSSLQIDQIGIKDDFVELGGNSLLAMTTMNVIKQRLGYVLSFEDVFTKSIKEIIQGIHNKEQSQTLDLNSVQWNKYQSEPELKPANCNQELSLFCTATIVVFRFI